jgi:hypothetical protein
MTATVITVHGQTFDIIPNRTAVEYRNGFCNNVQTFPSTYARDAWIEARRLAAKQYRATSFHYAKH